ncbi:MAG: tetratricopeptide repeat protein [Phycisphaerae bacterium]|nr:tetratricopeptide repeat protein [Phycisphaerae bacterium]
MCALSLAAVWELQGVPSVRLVLLAGVLAIGGGGLGCGRDDPPPVDPVSTSPAPPVPAEPDAAAEPSANSFALVPRPPERGFVSADNRIPQVKAMLRNNRFAQAEVLLGNIVKAHPGDPQSELLLGMAIHKQKRYGDARPHFARVIASRQAFPEVDHVFYLLGWCDYYLGELAGARKAFEEHQRRVPTEADSVFGLGLVAFDDGRVDDAKELFERAIAMQAGDPSAAREIAKAHARLGDVEVQRDELAAAETAFRRAVDLYPDHYEAWAKLARVLDRLGRGDDAAVARTQERAAMQRVGRVDPAVAPPLPPDKNDTPQPGG